MTEEKLRIEPCPFCGSECKVADNTGPKLCTTAHAYVFCTKRGCPGAGDEQDTVAEAVAAWNQRIPDTDSIRREVLEEAADDPWDLLAMVLFADPGPKLAAAHRHAIERWHEHDRSLIDAPVEEKGK